MCKWKLTTTVIGDKKFYGLYRIFRESELDHDGNRETYGFFETEEEAIEVMERLNEFLKI